MSTDHVDPPVGSRFFVNNDSTHFQYKFNNVEDVIISIFRIQLLA